MLTRSPGWTTTIGKHVTELKDAQIEELAGIIPRPTFEGITNGDVDKMFVGIARGIVDEALKVVDILTMSPNSKPRARKVNGGTKKRKASVQLAAE